MLGQKIWLLLLPNAPLARLVFMDTDEEYEQREEQYDAKQREASFAGLLAGLFILFLLGAGALALVTIWPFAHTALDAPSSPLPKTTD
jgi:hypothetical protein